jgi:hypothetical protein
VTESSEHGNGTLGFTKRLLLRRFRQSLAPNFGFQRPAPHQTHLFATPSCIAAGRGEDVERVRVLAETLNIDKTIPYDSWYMTCFHQHTAFRPMHASLNLRFTGSYQEIFWPLLQFHNKL